MTFKRHVMGAILFLLAGPVLAAPAGEDAATKARDTESALPASMQRHGVIGYVPPMDGLSLIDSMILERMRARLRALKSQDANE